MLEQGIIMRQQRSGLTALMVRIATRMRSSQGKAATAECARADAGKVKSTPWIGGSVRPGALSDKAGAAGMGRRTLR